MARTLDVATLEGAAQHFARQWLLPDRKSRNGKRFIQGRAMVIQDFNNFDFADELDWLLTNDAGIKGFLGGKALAEFEKAAKESLRPRKDGELLEALKRKLAIDPDGNHVEGAIGTTNIGSRIIMPVWEDAETPGSLRRRIEQGLPVHDPNRKDRITEPRLVMKWWPIYAGEIEEREAGNITPIGQPGADELPDGAFFTFPDGSRPESVGANVTNIAAIIGTLALDAAGDRVDVGTGNAEIRWRTGAQPADPDAAETGTLLGTNVMGATAFAAAVDDADGTVSKTANAISDDTSADATGTVGYGRMAATGTGADDHFDGNVNTTDGAFVANTTSFVAGSTITVTSCRLDLSQGSTAT